MGPLIPSRRLGSPCGSETGRTWDVAPDGTSAPLRPAAGLVAAAGGVRHPPRRGRRIGPGPAQPARLPPPAAAGLYRGAGRRLPGPPGARAPITGSHGGPGRGRPFFSMDADAQRRRQPPARPPPPPPAARLAGGRGAGTFPRPAARAAPRRRCRRGPGARPGQSGRAGRGGAAAACALVSPPGLPRRPAAARAASFPSAAAG